MKTKSKIGKVDEEKIVFDAFINELTSKDANVKISNKIREQNDPPDFWVNIEGVRYAFEVTSICDDSNLFKCNQLGTLANEIGIHFNLLTETQGRYLLESIRNPIFPKRRTAQRKDLISKSLSLIRILSNSPVGECLRLYEDNEGYLTLTKWSNGELSIDISFMPEAKSEVSYSLCDLYTKAIQTKFQILHNRGITENIILGLYDAYGFADKEDFINAFNNLNNYEWLHSVFICPLFSDKPNINSTRAGFFLYSKDKNWL